MAVYMIIEIEVRDEVLYSKYIDAVPEVVSRYGGRYLARGGRVTPLSERWCPERVILLEFDSMDRLNDCFASDEYARIAGWREASTRSRAIVVEGCLS